MRTLFYVRSGYQIGGQHQARWNGSSGFNAHQVGMGHVVRCARLAAHMDGAIILTHPDEPGCAYLRDTGMYPALAYDIEPEADMLNGIIKDRGIEMLVIDCMETNNDLLEAIQVPKLVVIVGVGWSITERTRALADLIIYQGVGRPSVAVQDAPGGKILRGIEYTIVGSPATPTARDGILVFVGGGIPWSYSVALCKQLDKSGLSGTVVAGWHIDDSADGLPASFAKRERLPGLSSLQASHLLQVSSMGMSVYEGMAAGIPVACVSRDEDHWGCANELDEAGLLVDCGLASETSPKELAGWAEYVYGQQLLREQIARDARHAVDGRGIERVIEAMG